ncbi:hypothetical protein [uncultured Campylobacter sp.]|uniref:hypothetical protein n=1 Tax=uncultured Campylobacter sp. TaxID=218934 RepID=UPI00261EEDE1|nr:hypothetical protein [uncultured Campylobacter sp.]
MKKLSFLKEKLCSAKAKLCSAVCVGFSAMSASAAGIAIDPATGAVTGDLDKATFMGVAGAVLVLLGVIFGVKKGLGLLR